jgi:hypothetical protein
MLRIGYWDLRLKKRKEITLFWKDTRVEKLKKDESRNLNLVLNKFFIILNH